MKPHNYDVITRFRNYVTTLRNSELDLAEWLERLAVNAKVATVLGSRSQHPPTQWDLRGGRGSNV
jgi:hypothetical protein